MCSERLGEVAKDINLPFHMIQSMNMQHLINLERGKWEGSQVLSNTQENLFLETSH